MSGWEIRVTPPLDEAASRLAPKGDHDRFDFGVAMNWRYDRFHLAESGVRLE